MVLNRVVVIASGDFLTQHLNTCVFGICLLLSFSFLLFDTKESIFWVTISVAIQK